MKKPTQSLKVEEAGKHLLHVAFTWHITLWDFNRTKYQPAERRVWGFPSQGEARYRRHLLTRSPKPFRSLKIKPHSITCRTLYTVLLLIFLGMDFNGFSKKSVLRIHKFVANDPVNIICYKILNFNKHLIHRSTQRNPGKLKFNKYWWHHSTWILLIFTSNAISYLFCEKYIKVKVSLHLKGNLTMPTHVSIFIHKSLGN